jgi:hypothetical protein
MAINLKQILITDSDNIKLDKINYNFDQLVSNGGGPQGPQGSVGETGPIGITGAQGVQGAQGFQGVKGIKGLDGGGYWNLVKGNLLDNSTSDVLYPLHDTESYPNDATNVVLGYSDTNTVEFNEYINSNINSVLTIRRENGFISNLRLLNLDSENAFDWISDVVNNDTIVTAKFNTTDNNKFINFANKFIFKAIGADVLNLNKNNLNINVNATFENDVIIDGNLKITGGDPGVDKSGFVAVSNDNQGTLVFKDTEDLGGTAPVGTIVSILPSIFESEDNFKKYEEYSISDPDNELLKIKLGSGIGDYSGWYICNGKTWTNGSDISYTTPDLNSFSYEIPDNPDSNTENTSQGLARVENPESPIIAGANISMNSDWNSGIYNISQTTEIEDDIISTGDLDNPYTTFDIKRFPQIIYLGVADLYWEDAGGDWAPINTVTHTFTDLNPDVDYVSTESFEDNSGASGSFIKFINPPANYYWDANSLPAITPPDEYTIGSVELVQASTNPGLYNERLKITVNYDSHPGFNKEIDFTFNSANHLILIPESTIILTVNVDRLDNGTTQKSIENTYTSILPVATEDPILGFDGNKYIIDAGQIITEDAYNDASIQITNINTGSPSTIIATKIPFNDSDRDPNKIEWTFSIAPADWPEGGTTETHEIAVEASNLLNDRIELTVIAKDITTINIAIEAEYPNNVSSIDYLYDGNTPTAENNTVDTFTEEQYVSWVGTDVNTVNIEFSAYTLTQDQQIEYIISRNYEELSRTNGVATESNPITTTVPLVYNNSSDLNKIVIEALYFNSGVIEDPNEPIEGLTAIQLYYHTTNVCDIPSTSEYYVDATSLSSATEIYIDADGDSYIYEGDQPDSGWFNDGEVSKYWSVEDGEFTQQVVCQTDTGGGDTGGGTTIQLYDIDLYEPSQTDSQYYCDTDNLTNDYVIDNQVWLDATKLYYKDTEELVNRTIVLNNGSGGWARRWDGNDFEDLKTCGGDGTSGTGGTEATINIPPRLSIDEIIYEHKAAYTNVNNDFDMPINDMPILGNQEEGENTPYFPIFGDDQFMQGDIVNNSNEPIEVWPTLFSNKDMMDVDDNNKILTSIIIYYKKYILDGTDGNGLTPVVSYDGTGNPELISLKVGWDNKNTLGSLATNQEAWAFSGYTGTYDSAYADLITPLVGWDFIEVSPSSIQRNKDGIWYRYGTNLGEGIHLNAGERVFIAGWTWDGRIDSGEQGLFASFDAEQHLKGNPFNSNDPVGKLALGFTYKQTGNLVLGEWETSEENTTFEGTQQLEDYHVPYPVVDPFNEDEEAIDID